MEMLSYGGGLLKIKEHKEIKVKKNILKIPAYFLALC